MEERREGNHMHTMLLLILLPLLVLLILLLLLLLLLFFPCSVFTDRLEIPIIQNTCYCFHFLLLWSKTRKKNQTPTPAFGNLTTLFPPAPPYTVPPYGPRASVISTTGQCYNELSHCYITAVRETFISLLIGVRYIIAVRLSTLKYSAL